MPPTHEVINQVPPLTGYDVADDPAMLDALRREGAGWAEAEVREIGLLAGTARAQDWGRLANENPGGPNRLTTPGRERRGFPGSRPGVPASRPTAEGGSLAVLRQLHRQKRQDLPPGCSCRR